MVTQHCRRLSRGTSCLAGPLAEAAACQGLGDDVHCPSSSKSRAELQQSVGRPYPSSHAHDLQKDGILTADTSFSPSHKIAFFSDTSRMPPKAPLSSRLLRPASQAAPPALRIVRIAPRSTRSFSTTPPTKAKNRVYTP